jgi:hypothetical protein
VHREDRPAHRCRDTRRGPEPLLHELRTDRQRQMWPAQGGPLVSRELQLRPGRLRGIGRRGPAAVGLDRPQIKRLLATR